jgi:3-hydroxybutyryl-CoA dehydrogenase
VTATEPAGAVGVVGLGSVGLSLARLMAASGVDVVAVDTDENAVARARAGGAEAGLDISALRRVGVVIEAATEHYEIKASVLRRLADVCAPDTALLSTTWSLSLASLAAVSGRPSRFAGLRLLAPPADGSVVEVVPTPMTTTGTVAAVRALLARLPLVEGPLGGAANDRARDIVLGYLNQAVALVESGYCTRNDVDIAMRLGCGLPCGPLELLDRIGLDEACRMLQDLHRRTGVAAHRPSPRLEELVAAGRLGRKAGRGFYDYTGATGEAVAGPASAPRPGPGAAPRAVRRVGIVGDGTMGRGIAQVTALAGLPTVLVSRSSGKCEASVTAVEQALVRAVRRGKITAGARDAALGLLEPTQEFAALAGCDVVIEAAVEDAEVKRGVFARLDEIARPGAVLATTTSSLSVTACAEATSRPADVVGMHFFNPAPAMRLIEIAYTEFTGTDVLATAHALAGRLGKTAVSCPDRAGFIVNFLLFRYLNDAVGLVENGDAGIAELDLAVRNGFGYPMGPFALLDTIGLDVSEAILQRLHETNADPATKPAALLTRLVELGRLGRKTGTGFHDHGTVD